MGVLMPALTYCNGKFTSPADARLSAHDAGVQHAVGLFETMLGVGPREAGGAPRIHRLGEHLVRLADSVIGLGLADMFDPAPLGELTLETLRRSGICAEPGSRARLRLTITGGDLSALDAARGGGGSDGTEGQRVRHQPSVLISAQPASVYPDALFNLGGRVVLSDLRLNPFDAHEGHKTTNYWRRLRALQEAAQRGASEGLVFTVTGHLAGACVANVLLVKDGRLLTPSARGEDDAPAPGGGASPVLPGITRLAVMEIAASKGIEVERRALTLDDALDADEMMFTNSTMGVCPVTAIEAHAIGGADPSSESGLGRVGPVTAALREGWLAELQ